MAICILVLKEEKTADEFWEKLKESSIQITNFQVIEPHGIKPSKDPLTKSGQNHGRPKNVKLIEVKLLNPKLSRKERQTNMALWLMPFGFIAGLTFAGMTDLKTFSSLGFNFGQSFETISGGLLGMLSGWIGSFFAARSVNTNQDDLKSLLKSNEQGLWLILLETPFETELPWQIINAIKPIDIVNLNLI